MVLFSPHFILLNHFVYVIVSYCIISFNIIVSFSMFNVIVFYFHIISVP